MYNYKILHVIKTFYHQNNVKRLFLITISYQSRVVRIRYCRMSEISIDFLFVLFLGIFIFSEAFFYDRLIFLYWIIFLTPRCLAEFSSAFSCRLHFWNSAIIGIFGCFWIACACVELNYIVWALADSSNNADNLER